MKALGELEGSIPKPRHAKAMEYFCRAIDLCEQTSFLMGTASDCYYSLGQIEISIGEFTRGNEHIQRALDLAMELADQTRIERARKYLTSADT